jgi:L-asparaginase II
MLYLEQTKLVDVYRGGRVESSHFGHIAVVDSNGKLLASIGDPYRRTYARSAVKPIQVIPVIETGAAEHYNLSEADISLCCASHSGEEQHTERALGILKKAGLLEEALQCGTHIPKCQDAYKKLIVENRELSPRYNNCSGKHSGMLITAKHMNESLEDYYLPNHPVQQRIIQAMSDVAEYPKEDIGIGIDGCGVPVFELPLERFAYAFARLAKPETLGAERGKVVERITTAMTTHPEMVGGTDRFCTDFMKAGKGRFFGKAGAESVYCIGDRETGIGIALKIEDGNDRAMYPVALEVLKQLGLFSAAQLEEVKQHYRPSLRNARKEEIGKLIASFKF